MREWLRQRIKDPVTGVQVQRALLQDALRRNLPGDTEVAKSAIEQNPQSEIGDRVSCLEIGYRTVELSQLSNHIGKFAFCALEDQKP